MKKIKIRIKKIVNLMSRFEMLYVDYWFAKGLVYVCAIRICAVLNKMTLNHKCV